MKVLVPILALLLGTLLWLVLRENNDNQFQLLQNPKPIPVETLPPEAPGYVPDQTMQASPAVIDLPAQPGQELQPLLISSTIDIDLRVRVQFQSQFRGDLQLSEKDFILPANTKKEIGLRVAPDITRDVFGSLVVSSKLLRGEAAKIRGKSVSVIPSLALEIPVALSLPLGAESAQWSLQPPRLEDISGGLRAVLPVRNSSERIWSGSGKLILEGQETSLETPIGDNQFVAPQSIAALQGEALWKVPGGTYILRAEALARGERKVAGRRVVVGGSLQNTPTRSASVEIQENEGQPVIFVQNGGEVPLRNLRVFAAGTREKINYLGVGKSRALPFFLSSKTTVSLWQNGRKLDSNTWSPSPPAKSISTEKSNNWLRNSLLLAILFGALLFFVLRSKKKPSDALESSTDASQQSEADLRLAKKAKRGRRRRREADWARAPYRRGTYRRGRR